MAKSTFSGPVRSEDTFKTVSKAAATGAITEVITLGDGPVTLGDEDTTLTNATHSGRLIVVPVVFLIVPAFIGPENVVVAIINPPSLCESSL